MNKLFTKIATAFVGIAMAVGVGVAIGNNSNFVKAGAVAASYTIEFDDSGSGDGSALSSTTSFGSVFKTGYATYVTTTKVNNNDVNFPTATKAYFGGKSGLKLGASSSAGAIKFSLTSIGQVTPTSIVVSARRYNNNQATLSVNGSTAQTLTNNYDSGLSNYTFEITSAITYIQMNSSKYLWVSSITVNYDAASTTNCKSITATAPRSYIYIGEDMELGYTAKDVNNDDWTGDVDYSITSVSPAGAATIDGNILTGVSAGTVTVQAVDHANNATTKVTKTLTIKDLEDLPANDTYVVNIVAEDEEEDFEADEYLYPAKADTSDTWYKRVLVDESNLSIDNYHQYNLSNSKTFTITNQTNGIITSLEIKYYGTPYYTIAGDGDALPTPTIVDSSNVHTATYSNFMANEIVMTNNGSGTTKFYYAKVTISTVDAIKSISIKNGTSLTKTTQAAGSAFDPTGLVFVVDYLFENDVEVGSPYTGFTWGDLVVNAGKVTGTYTDANDLTATIDVPVTIINDTLTAIAFDVVNSNMSKKEYYTDDADFDFSGVIVSGTYSVTGAAADVTSKVTISADKTIAQLGRGKHTIKLSAVVTDNTDIATTSTYDVNIQIFAAKSSILVEEVVANYDFTDSTVNSGSVVSKTNFDDQNKLSTNNLKTLSNVSYTYIGNTQAQGGESNRYGYIRMANGSNAGSFTVEFTKNVNKVIVEARRWNNNTASGFTLTVNNQEFEFTDKENHETHTFEFNAAKTIAFSAASGRSVFIYKMTFKYESNEKKSDDALALYRFSDNYLHMNDYDKELHVGQDGNNWCKDGEHHYYSDAYTYYTTTLTDAQRILFQNSAFANERARFVAWAAANSQTISFNSSTGAIQSNSGAVVFNLPAETNTVATFIAIIAVVSTLSVGGFFFIRKKKNVK